MANSSPRSRKHLGADEQVVRRMHTHAKALILPVMALLALAPLVGFGLAWLPADAQPWGSWALLGVGLVLLLGLVVLPILRWWCNTWTLTTRRIIHRQGILTRSGHDLPLTRINDIASERGLIDRVLGCGTLKLTTAAEDPVYLRDIPDVERVHVMLSELLFGSPDQALEQADEEWRD
ncbi:MULTISPECIES: PH domain-containing protein [unclassified Luteococcus]|uniref:PH domain-containing protein n=1 Tax=unclassified Luteococcus TaxID=2639923 RepID=UPI00313EB551